ncbi:hypothetical protein [uncultured Clostridium sp.]|uniref:hypothetical protein n=1 Tax=uncultured Clostridium sp. TaxID=59620 RepID=UPI00260FBF47|nr:hypothetical protein [uncultured Clostridium sp.]
MALNNDTEMTVSAPAVVTLKNVSDRRIGFVPYKENFTSYIPAGFTLHIEVATAGQVFYYMAQATEGLEVTHEAKTADSGTNA